jgi:hypothetical protein
MGLIQKSIHPTNPNSDNWVADVVCFSSIACATGSPAFAGDAKVFRTGDVTKEVLLV